MLHARSAFVNGPGLRDLHVGSRDWAGITPTQPSPIKGEGFRYSREGCVISFRRHDTSRQARGLVTALCQVAIDATAGEDQRRHRPPRGRQGQRRAARRRAQLNCTVTVFDAMRSTSPEPVEPAARRATKLTFFRLQRVTPHTRQGLQVSPGRRGRACRPGLIGAGDIPGAVVLIERACDSARLRSRSDSSPMDCCGSTRP